MLCGEQGGSSNTVVKKTFSITVKSFTVLLDIEIVYC